MQPQNEYGTYSQGAPYPKAQPGAPPPPPVGFQLGNVPPAGFAPNYTAGTGPPGVGYPPTSGYPPASGYPPTSGYPPPSGYPPAAGYPSGPSYPPGGQSYPYSSGFPQTNQPYNEPPPTYVSSENNGYDTDSMKGWEGFTDKAIRRVFIRKVYSILMLQLGFTTAVIALFIFVPKVKYVVQRHTYLYIISYVAFLALYITLICCSELRRKWPTNIILLSLFTVSLSYLVGAISSYHDTNIVLMTMGICAACCLAITIFSFNTKIDLTSCGGVLFILCFVLFLFGILTIFTYNRIMNTIYAGFGALLFMLFLAYDTQMLMGGKKHQLSAEEHIFAALQLYLDIVYIFLFLLSLMGDRK